MTFLSLPVTPSSVTHGHSSGRLNDGPLWPYAIVCALFASCLGAALYPLVWNTGFFGDPDDAMRMVQIRDFMAGQAWYDMITYRLDPAHHHFIHWSRIVDVIIVGLIKFFSLFLSAEYAERAARIAYPLLMLFALFMAIARAARSLMGHSAVLPALILCALAGIGAAQFQPGRIDHHSLQIVLLANMLAFTLEALEPDRSRASMKAAAAASVSLGISVENIPFIVAMTALWPLAWSISGEPFRKQMLAYFGGLLIAMPLVFLATVGPARWFVAGCDAISASYLLPVIIGASGCCLLTYRTLDTSPAGRFLLAAATGIAATAALVWHTPSCFGNPFSNVETFLWRYWLDNVHEARPLYWSFIHSRPYTVLVAGPAFLCGFIAFVAAWRAQGAARTAWIFTSLFICAGIAATGWQIRAASSLQPLAMLGGAWAILHFRSWLESRKLDTAAILALALTLPLSTTGWEAAWTSWKALARLAPTPAISTSSPSAAEATAPAMVPHSAESCRSKASYDVLTGLPKGLVLNPIDIGAHVLVYSEHSSLAAGYHRNNRGNRTAVEALIAPEREAETIVRANNVDYIVMCTQHAELDYIREYGPKGLGAGLAKGIVPSWLERLTSVKDPVEVFRVKKL